VHIIGVIKWDIILSGKGADDMLFEKIDRTVVSVLDIDEAIAFFKDLMEVRFDETIIDEELQLKVVHSGGFGLEFVMPMSTDTLLAAAEMESAKRAGGSCLRTLVVKVSDLDEAVDKFRRKGIEPIAFLENGAGREAHFNPKDTYGVAICLNEFPDIHPMNHISRQYFEEKRREKKLDEE